MSFAELNLHPSILKALHQLGYDQPTRIQQEAIPRVLANKDLIGVAQTGTGKTAAFALPVLQHLLQTRKQQLPQVLILAPVRELAAQITDEIYKYSKHAPIKVVNILGGMPYQAQMRQLRQGVDIIVATPGRLIDYLKRGQIDLSQIKILILDEADRMLDMGFIESIKLINSFLPKQRQTLLFTATMDEPVVRLAQKILHQPEQIIIPGKAVTLENIKQSIYMADDMQHKNNLLTHFIKHDNIYKALIFAATKRYAERLSYYLRDHGCDADALHGDIKQNKRNQILGRFHRGEIQFLVATDLAARGINVQDVTHVFNYDLPRTGEDYVHRIGRTGRAGKSGIAISFVGADEVGQLKRIERFIKAQLLLQQIAGLEPKKPQRTDLRKTKKFGAHKRNNQHHRFRKDSDRKFNRSGKKYSAKQREHS